MKKMNLPYIFYDEMDEELTIEVASSTLISWLHDRLIYLSMSILGLFVIAVLLFFADKSPHFEVTPPLLPLIVLVVSFLMAIAGGVLTALVFTAEHTGKTFTAEEKKELLLKAVQNNGYKDIKAFYEYLRAEWNKKYITEEKNAL